MVFGEEIGAPDGVSERALASWLLSCGCRRLKAGGRKAKEGNHGSSSDTSDSESDSEYEPCQVCGRCYPHEHITAVYGDAAADVSDEDDEDDLH